MIGKGLTLPGIHELYGDRPQGNDLVLFVAKRLWRVAECSLRDGCRLQEVRGLQISDLYWDVVEPEATNYWYIPLKGEGITYPSLPEE